MVFWEIILHISYFMENKLFLIIINSYDLLAFKVSCLLFFVTKLLKMS